MKKLMLIMLGFVGLVTASCQRDTPTGIDSGGDAFTLRLSVAGHETGASRAMPIDPEAGEENIGSLYLLFYAPSGDRSGVYESYIKLDGPLVMNQNIKVNMSANPSLNATDAYKILAVANLDQYAPYMGVTVNEWLSQLEGKTESYAYKQITAYIDASQALSAENLIMTGEASKGAGGLELMQIALKRGAVRFDVVNNIRSSYDLASVSIWNAFPELNLFGGGLTDYNKSRIQRFYGVDNTGNVINVDQLGDIFGGLYTFPNQVVNPEKNDAKTTCLIIGLRARGSSAITYHRINISARDAMQDLKRNNVYRITIQSVNGDGAGTEMEAYTGGTNEINYQINYWELDDEGLIQQNGNIILGIPTKRIKLGPEADERSYDIFAFGGAPNEQIVVSTAWDNDDARNNISVTQSGNTITVRANALMPNTERSGSITITYAGLTATIGVIQTGTASQFLRVITSGGSGIPAYPGFAGAAMDGTLTVEASGNWTATIYNLEANNFSFTQPNTYTGTKTGASGSVILPIYTFIENTTTSSRNAFVSISLDDDPDNYSAAVVLTQKALGSLAVSPSLTKVDWDGLGKVTTAGKYSDTEFKFNVMVKADMGVYDEWEAVLTDIDNVFEIVSEGHSTTTLADNYIIVKAKGETTAGSHNATLRLQLQTSAATGVDIALVQTGYTMGITQPTTPVSNKGGQSSAVTVSSNGATLTWSVTINSTASATGTLTNHDAYIVDGATGTELTQGDKFPLSKTFKVAFPKLMYGNHKKGAVTATATVKLWSGTNEVGTRTITVTQNELSPKNVNLVNYHGRPENYGNLYSNTAFYSAGWRTFLTTMFSTTGSEAPAYPEAPATPFTRVYSPNAISLPTGNTTTSPVASNVTYVHASMADFISNASTSADCQGAIENWRAADNGILFAGTQWDSSTPLFWPLRSIGLSKAGNAYNSAAWTIRSGSDRKIRDFIYNKGPFGPVGNDASLDGSNDFYIDAYSQSLNITGSTTAVAIVGNDSRASIVIDPVNRVIFVADDQMFGRNATSIDSADNVSTNLASSKSRLLANLQAYVVLTAQYGSNFSDLFID